MKNPVRDMRWRMLLPCRICCRIDIDTFGTHELGRYESIRTEYIRATWPINRKTSVLIGSRYHECSELRCMAAPPALPWKVQETSRWCVHVTKETDGLWSRGAMLHWKSPPYKHCPLPSQVVSR